MSKLFPLKIPTVTYAPRKTYGTTSDGWTVQEPPTMTTRARSAFAIFKEDQSSLIESRTGYWYYMRTYDTAVLPPTGARNNYLLSIRGKNVMKSKTLEGALLGLGLDAENAKEAWRIIVSAK